MIGRDSNKSGFKTLLLAHPRSGSSNLFHTLNLHPRLTLLEEPFHEQHHTWQAENKNHRARLHDIDSFEAEISDIFNRFDGFKLLGYQLPDPILDHFLRLPGLRILFLRRHNLLQTIVSNLIANQTGLWKKWEQTAPIETLYANLEPLNIDEIKQRIKGLAAHLDRCEAILDQRPAQSVLKLSYEHLYFSEPEAQAAQLNHIWSFLDLEPFDSEKVNYYMRPQRAKINSAETYRHLPNAAEIDRLCGSDQTGRLFE